MTRYLIRSTITTDHMPQHTYLLKAERRHRAYCGIAPGVVSL